jgi:hypothetical protein
VSDHCNGRAHCGHGVRACAHRGHARRQLDSDAGVRACAHRGHAWRQLNSNAGVRACAHRSHARRQLDSDARGRLSVVVMDPWLWLSRGYPVFMMVMNALREHWLWSWSVVGGWCWGCD